MQLTKYLFENIQKKKQCRGGSINERTKSMGGAINPILKTILEGVYDNNCQLSMFRGTPHIIQLIYSYVIQYWKSLILCNENDDTKEEGNIEILY